MKLFKSQPDTQKFTEPIIFINASEHAQGNTSRLGQQLLAGKDFTKVDLVNYRIDQLSQHFEDDQFDEILDQIQDAQTIIVGIPIYWHLISGYAKTFFERLSRDSDEILIGKQLGVFIHGSEPSDAVASTGNLVQRFAQVEQMDNLGVWVL